MEIFQLSISGETHLKRLKRLEIYGKFQSPVQKRAQRAHISRKISRNRKLQMGQIPQRISGNVCKCQDGGGGDVRRRCSRCRNYALRMLYQSLHVPPLNFADDVRDTCEACLCPPCPWAAPFAWLVLSTSNKRTRCFHGRLRHGRRCLHIGTSDGSDLNAQSCQAPSTTDTVKTLVSIKVNINNVQLNVDHVE